MALLTISSKRKQTVNLPHYLFYRAAMLGLMKVNFVK